MADGEAEILHTGTYREIDRPRRLVFTWSSPVTGFRDTVVTVTFEARATRPSSRSIRSVCPTTTRVRRTKAAGRDALRLLAATHGPGAGH